MMKKFLVLLGVVGIFVACDYASEAVETKPDIEVVEVKPMGCVTSDYDSTIYAEIEEIRIIARNSVDCYLDKLIYEYHYEDTMFYGPEEWPIYAKINGIVDECAACTTKILGVPVPLAPVRDFLDMGQAARVMLRFVAVGEYFDTEYDTSDCWFGVYMLPFDTTDCWFGEDMTPIE